MADRKKTTRKTAGTRKTSGQKAIPKTVTENMTAKEVEYFDYMQDAMQRFEWDLHSLIYHNHRIPHEWTEIAKRRETGRVKIGFSCDADVAKWFRSFGPGYQRRMNDVLRAFMQAKLSGLLNGEDTHEAFRPARRPGFGDFAAEWKGRGR
ncbi:MAG: BrnA antitoxin family protein [Pseudomonadota bacterium]